jgi:hypothetical protein
MHDIWYELTRDPEYSHLHHYHVVSAALREFQSRLHGSDRSQALSDLQDELDRDDDT